MITQSVGLAGPTFSLKFSLKKLKLCEKWFALIDWFNKIYNVGCIDENTP